MSKKGEKSLTIQALKAMNVKFNEKWGLKRLDELFEKENNKRDPLDGRKCVCGEPMRQSDDVFCCLCSAGIT